MPPCPPTSSCLDFHGQRPRRSLGTTRETARRLRHDREGRGLWVSPEAFLAKGEGTVTVTPTTPEASTAVTTAVVAPLAAPVPPEPLASAVSGGSAATQNPTPASVWPGIAGVPLLAVTGGVITVRNSRGKKVPA
ncbi:hypothetical protein ACX80D_16805 [Arthrobacter sp. Sr24]